MIDYKTSFANTNNVDFPDTESVNASGGAATDGTEFVKLMIDDIWGRFQAIMDYAGLTPNSVTEAPGASQHIEAIQKGFAVGPGIGVTYWKNGDPATNGDRVLLLNGQGVLRTSYPELDAAVYVGDGNNAAVSAGGGMFYHADDAAGTIPNPAGIYLILPDSRGRVLRDSDPAASVDPDGASRFLGGAQLDSIQGHWHQSYYQPNGFEAFFSVPKHGIADGGNTIPLVLTSARDAITDTVNGTPRTSLESRMVNIQTRYGITY